MENLKREEAGKTDAAAKNKRKRLNMTSAFVPNNVDVEDVQLSKYARNNLGSGSERAQGKAHSIKAGPQYIDLTAQMNLSVSHPFVDNNCPNVSHSTIFLWRNVSLGNNMLERFLLKKIPKEIRKAEARRVRKGRFPNHWGL